MRSSLVKHLWLIQPNDHHSPVLPLDAAGGATIHFSPSWDLLCLRAFILERTGHTCELIDVRCHAGIEEAFAVTGTSPAHDATSIAVIHTTTANLGSVGAIARFLKMHHPEMPIALFGPHVNAFPETIFLIQGIDYGLFGDPELKLRHLLDSLDIPHRLKLMPGLLMPGATMKPVHWADDLRGLSFPDWQTIDWVDYRHSPSMRGANIEARLSRGNPGTPADIPWPSAQEPLRVWPLPGMAQTFQKCPGNGIDEIFLADPPGLWSDQRLLDWINQLKRLRNTQLWSFQIVARILPPNIISELAVTACARIEIIIPTLDEKRQASLGMSIRDADLRQLIEQLRNAGVDPHIIFWIEGPWRVENEAGLIADKVRTLGRPSYAVYPFPFHIDSALYRQVCDAGASPPRLDEWIAWAQREDTEAPAELWSGAEGLPRAEATMKSLTRRIARDPWRAFQLLLSGGHSSLRTKIEQQTVGTLQRVAAKLGRKKANK